ncbi:MAG: site-specific DNA-methyltransferase [bacterium]
MASLNWIGKDAVVNHDKEVSFKLLEKVPSASVGKESKNLIIHGDNLEALKALMPFYKGKIKCVYIDPPYNTGNEGWVYNDKVNSPKIREWLGKVVGSEGEDLTRHDKWLCMMYPRLKLLRDLLSEDGVIFVSIDDNEHCNLKLIMDEIFGGGNFIGNFVVNTTPNARDYGHMGKMHDFCIFYAKNILKTQTNMLEDKEKTFKYSDNISGFNIHPLYNSNVAFTNKNRPNLYYPFYLNKNKPVKEFGDNFYEISLNKSKNSIEIFPPKSVKDNVQFVWRWGREKSLKNINKEILGYETSDGEYRIVQKMRTSEKLIRSILSEKEYTSRRGTAILEDIFGVKTFSFPKPVELIKAFVKVATNSDSIVLDSFSGSGTTGHAVLDLNKEDGGSRKFILVEMEDNIAKESTAERIKKSIKKYGYNDGFEFCELAKPLFNEKGQINEACSYEELASYIYFTETQTNIDKKNIQSQFIGENQDTSYYLIYKGKNKNDLNRSGLSKLKIRGPAVIYADRCLVDEDILREKQIIFKQIPYEIKLY